MQILVIQQHRRIVLLQYRYRNLKWYTTTITTTTTTTATTTTTTNRIIAHSYCHSHQYKHNTNNNNNKNDNNNIRIYCTTTGTVISTTKVNDRKNNNDHRIIPITTTTTTKVHRQEDNNTIDVDDDFVDDAKKRLQDNNYNNKIEIVIDNIRYDTIQAQLVEINDRTTTPSSSSSSSSVQVSSSCDHHHRIRPPLYQSQQQIIHLSYTTRSNHHNIHNDDHDHDNNNNQQNDMVSVVSNPSPPSLNTNTNTNDVSNVQVLSIHPIWLWCNDPTFIHETSGQHLRTHRLMYYYRQLQNIRIQSIQVIPATMSDGMTTIPTIHPHPAQQQPQTQHLPEPVTVVIPIPSPSSGIIHPRHVLTVSNNHNNSGSVTTTTTTTTTTTVPSLLLHVIWAVDSSHQQQQQQHQMESYYDMSWLIRCLQNDNNNSVMVTNDDNKYTNPIRVTSQPQQQQQPIGNHHPMNNYSHSDNISTMVPCYNYNDLIDNNHCNSEETLHSHHNNVVQQQQLSNMGCYHLLHNVFQHGAVLVSHVPSSLTQYQNYSTDSKNNDHDHNSPVATFGKSLSGGRLSHGQLYGDVFHVRDKTKPSNVASVVDIDTRNNNNNNNTTTANTNPSNDNIAYTTLALCPHQDLAYYESIPGLQLLHCIENDIDTVHGGESTLIDVIAAATEFQKFAPDLFDVLVYCEATFLKQRDGADMIYRRPHIQYSKLDRRITSVRWSPPFEGPLLSLPLHLMDDYYVAYSAFERMIDNALPRLHTTNDHAIVNRLLPRIPYELEIDLCNYANTNTWEYRLRPGDLLIFNNQRMLHGRRAYTFVSPPANTPTQADVGPENEGTNTSSCTGRHLMGCYTNIDDTLCHYRLLRRNFYKKLYELPYIPIVGNGSSRVP